MELSEKQVFRIAGFELSALLFSKVFLESLEGARIEDTGTVIYDLDGTALFRRVPVELGRRMESYADIAVLDIFAEPLLAVDLNSGWNEAAMLRRASRALLRIDRGAKYDETRFVAYSYPKIAVQFLLDGREVAMLELYSWAKVPPISERGRKVGPSNFERWSLIKETPDKIRMKNAETFEKRIAYWDNPEFAKIDPTQISVSILEDMSAVLKKFDTRDVHYAPRVADHHICYELRGQQTTVWCVAASVEMILNFYRYRYDQPRIADELDLGTCLEPNGLPYGQEIKVVNALEKLSSNTLDANMIATPGWTVHRDEIRAHRPLISFVPGHSRTVAGYTESLINLFGELSYQGLLVYDPWPATDCDHPEAGGEIKRWENFRNQTYRYAFTAEIQHV